MLCLINRPAMSAATVFFAALIVVSTTSSVASAFVVAPPATMPSENAFAAAAPRRPSTSSSRVRPAAVVVALAAEAADAAAEKAEDKPETATEEKPLEPTVSTPPVEPGSQEELLYTLGVNLARQLGDVRPLVETGEELTQLARGLLDAVVGRLDEAGQRELLARRGQDLNKLVSDRANSIRQRIEDSGRAMLKEMAANEATFTLDSGVVVHPLEAGPEGFGQGVRPTASSTVKVHYHGTLPDGTVFDSTLNGDPVTFPLGGVIAGWKEGLQKMHEGETAMLGIPPEMAYGAEGTPDGRIPGGASLFFKIQLIEVLTAGVGGGPTLVGADGKQLKSKSEDDGGGGSGLLGADGKPL